MKNNKTKIFKSKRFALALALLTVAALGSGCGQQAYDENTGNAGGTSGSTGSSTGGTTTTTTSTSGTTPTVTTTNTNSSPNYSFHFEMTGQGTATQVGGGSLTVSTDTVLQVSVTAGNGIPLAGSGFTPGFNCEMFNIQVGDVQETAFVKKQNYTDYPLMYEFEFSDPCQNAQTTWTYDFSSALAPGHSNVPIVINGAQYDNCRKLDAGSNYYYLYTGTPAVEVGGCPMDTVYSSHTVDGFIQVTTD